MSILSSNITAGTSLSISVSGTATLQRALATSSDTAFALKALGNAPSPSAGKKETAESALFKASQQTRDAILEALQLYDPKATLTGYKNGQHYAVPDGRTIDLIA